MPDRLVVQRDHVRGYLWMLEFMQAMGSQSSGECIVELDAGIEYGDQSLCNPFRVLEQHADALADYSARKLTGRLRCTSDLRTIRTDFFENFIAVSAKDAYEAPLKWAQAFKCV
jgi:hypothetical protein